LNNFAVFVIGLGVSLVPLDFSVNVAFPAITNAFSLPTQSIRWIPFSYVLTYGLLVIGFGALGDRLGHLRIFRAGLVLAIFALSMCALAPNYHLLIAARILQGISAAILLSCAPAIVTFLFAESKRTKALSIYGSMTAVAGVIAPLIGGFVIAWVDWPGVFWFRVPIAILSLLLLQILIIKEKIPAPDRSLRISASDQPTFQLMFQKFKKDHRFIGVNALSAVIQFSSFSLPLLIPYYLTNIERWEIEKIGFLLSTWALGTLVGSWSVDQLTRKLSTHFIAYIGAWLSAISLLIIALWSTHANLDIIYLAVIIQGFGLGLFQVAYSDFVIKSLPLKARGIAGGITVMTRTVGVAIGSLVWLWILDLNLSTRKDSLSIADSEFIQGFQMVFLIAAGVIPVFLAFQYLVNQIFDPKPAIQKTKI
jgi:MFS family permease